VFSAHDYENLAAVNIARAGGLTMWKGYSDIATYVHDDSVGRTNASTVTTTTSQDYLDAIADDYADCKTQSSLQTIPEESEVSMCFRVVEIGNSGPRGVPPVQFLEGRTLGPKNSTKYRKFTKMRYICDFF